MFLVLFFSLEGVSSLENLEWLNLSGNSIEVICHWKVKSINLESVELAKPKGRTPDYCKLTWLEPVPGQQSTSKKRVTLTSFLTEEHVCVFWWHFRKEDTL